MSNVFVVPAALGADITAIAAKSLGLNKSKAEVYDAAYASGMRSEMFASEVSPEHAGVKAEVSAYIVKGFHARARDYLECDKNTLSGELLEYFPDLPATRPYNQKDMDNIAAKGFMQAQYDDKLEVYENTLGELADGQMLNLRTGKEWRRYWQQQISPYVRDFSNALATREKRANGEANKPKPFGEYAAKIAQQFVGKAGKLESKPEMDAAKKIAAFIKKEVEKLNSLED